LILLSRNHFPEATCFLKNTIRLWKNFYRETLLLLLLLFFSFPADVSVATYAAVQGSAVILPHPFSQHLQSRSRAHLLCCPQTLTPLATSTPCFALHHSSPIAVSQHVLVQGQRISGGQRLSFG
jgi:hypothetical protein